MAYVTPTFALSLDAANRLDPRDCRRGPCILGRDPRKSCCGGPFGAHDLERARGRLVVVSPESPLFGGLLGTDLLAHVRLLRGQVGAGPRAHGFQSWRVAARPHPVKTRGEGRGKPGLALTERRYAPVHRRGRAEATRSV